MIVLVILTIAVVVLIIIEAVNNFGNKDGKGWGIFWNHNNEEVVYRGEIYPEQVKARRDQVKSMAKTTIQFYESKYDFGSVEKGQVLKHAFRFKNTGSNPLMIDKAEVTCGCTVPEYPMDAISPGSEGEITVVFNTSGNEGVQHKEVAIRANTLPNPVTIIIEANVK